MQCSGVIICSDLTIHFCWAYIFRYVGLDRVAVGVLMMKNEEGWGI